MGSVLKPIQTLKEYFWCHFYCAQLAIPLHQIVGASRTVSNRESRYPPRNDRPYANRNPECCGDFSQLVEIKKLKFTGMSRYKFKSRFWLNLNSFVCPSTNSNCDVSLQLTKISPPIRISIFISTIIPSLIFHGTGCAPIPLGVTFSKAQSSKLEGLFCHVSVKRDVRAMSFELWALKQHSKMSPQVGSAVVSYPMFKCDDTRAVWFVNPRVRFFDEHRVFTRQY